MQLNNCITIYKHVCLEQYVLFFPYNRGRFEIGGVGNVTKRLDMQLQLQIYIYIPRVASIYINDFPKCQRNNRLINCSN